MSSFRKNKIHSDFKLSDIKKLMFVCQSKKEPGKLFFRAVVNKGEAGCGRRIFASRVQKLRTIHSLMIPDLGKEKSGSRGYEPL